MENEKQAARATPAQPVGDLSDAKIDEIVRRYFSDTRDQNKAKDVIQEVLDAAKDSK